MTGIFGLIANPLARIDGVLSTFSDESLNMLLWNCIGGAVLIAWHTAFAVVQFVTLDRLGILRVTSEDEIQGLDVVKHKEKAYGFGRGTSPLTSAYPPSKNNRNVMTVAYFSDNKVDAMSLHTPNVDT